MEQEADREIDRHPRQIEQGDRSESRQEAAHILEIAQRLHAVAPIAGDKREPHHRIIDPRAQRLVEALANADENPAANEIQHALRGVQPGGEREQHDEGRHAAARQHAVVDFQHEHRAGKHQHVAHAGECADRDERAATGGKRLREFGARLILLRSGRSLEHRHQARAARPQARSSRSHDSETVIMRPRQPPVRVDDEIRGMERGDLDAAR